MYLDCSLGPPRQQPLTRYGGIKSFHFIFIVAISFLIGKLVASWPQKVSLVVQPTHGNDVLRGYRALYRCVGRFFLRWDAFSYRPPLSSPAPWASSVSALPRMAPEAPLVALACHFFFIVAWDLTVLSRVLFIARHVHNVVLLFAASEISRPSSHPFPSSYSPPSLLSGCMRCVLQLHVSKQIPFISYIIGQIVLNQEVCKTCLQRV
jgi:hypothetical protein